MAVNKIEQFLIELKYGFREVKSNIWMLSDSELVLEGMMLIHEDPLFIIRMQVMSVPKENREAFFAKLLELNARDMIRGTYGLEGEKIVITDTYEYEPLTLTEFRSSLEAIGLALTQHYPILSVYMAPHQK